jgi:uncharacterized protein GlcG (DUF336 family)
MKRWFAASFLLAALIFCSAARAQMTSNEVRTVISQAASLSVNLSPNAVIAISDREGFVLGVWSMNPIPAANVVANAIGKAGTAAYLSSDQHAFTSRTAGYIVQQNFPPGVQNRPPGPLVGVNFSNLDFSDVNHFWAPPFVNLAGGRAIGQTPPLPVTGGLAGTPGGVPLYRGGQLIGGVGVAGDGDNEIDIQVEQRPDPDEAIALAGQTGFEPDRMIRGSRILIDGFRLPYTESTRPYFLVRRTAMPDSDIDSGVLSQYPINSSPNSSYPTAVLGGAPGEIRQPIINDPIVGILLGQSRLTALEVTNILARGAARAITTRAGIRLPAGESARVFITVVNNPGQPGIPATVLGTFRVADATLFSWDVAVQKARTSVYFSNQGRALSTRAVGFLAQSMLPPGIESTSPGPLLGVQEIFSRFAGTNPLNGAVAPNPPQVYSELPNGITIFPGGFPLYRNGVLVGAVGISGDGVDQDDLIGIAAAAGFFPPDHIRADRFEVRGARLPYARFPRNPNL